MVLGVALFGQVDYYAAPPTQAVQLYNASRVNTADMEFCPAIYSNGLVYVSRFKNGPINPETGETYFELFYAEFDPMGLPGKPQPFSMQLNSAYHEGPVSFNRDGTRIFFTRTNLRNGVRRSDNKGQVGLKIYESRRGPYDWSPAQELSFNSDEYSCLHPSLSADGQRLFFASNKPGGYGGLDLYMVELQGGGWSQPINLGPDINTSRNEAFPFMHESGILFFSSDGHPGEGKLDLFMVDLSVRGRSPVLNMGPPFCSPADDLGIVLQPNALRGYFTSDRPGGYGKDDIYLFHAPDGLKGIEVSPELKPRVTVYEKSTSRRITGASVKFYELNSEGIPVDKSLYDLVMKSESSDRNEMTFGIQMKPPDAMDIPTVNTDRNGETFINVSPAKRYVLLVTKEGYQTVMLPFQTTTSGTNIPLEIIMQPSNCVNLDGQLLSEQYNSPVPGGRVTIFNKCTSRQEELVADLNGQFTVCLELGCEYDIRAFKEGYSEGTSTVSTIRIRGSRSLDATIIMHAESEAVIREPLPMGTIITLPDIEYDYAKSYIRKGESRDLESLLQILERFPSITIELSAHTDSRGDAGENLTLSLKRAESAKNWLVQRGIAPNRINAVGYGEALLKNDCRDGVQCTEAQHAVNRRTEAKILSIDEDIEMQLSRGIPLPKD